MSQPTLRASCLCKSTTFTLRNQPIRAVLCHCDNCKRWSGTAFATNVWFEEPSLTTFSLSSPPETIKKYIDKSTDSGGEIHRHFCTECGSCLYLTCPNIPGIVSVVAGIVEGLVFGDGAKVVPELEIFCKVKARWVEIKGETEERLDQGE